jgi:hypothetical protein
MKLCASRETTFGKRLRPDRVRFSMTRSSESSVYSIRGIGMYPTLNERRIRTENQRGTWGVASTHLVEQRRQKHLANIHPQIRFELQTPLAIKQQILRQPRPILSEPCIQRILSHRLEPIPDRMEQVVKVTLVLVVVEVSTGFSELVAFRVARWLEDETGLEENLMG